MFMIGLFYYNTLGNLSPKYQSSPFSLLPLLTTTYCNVMAMKQVFVIFIDDVKALECVSNVFHVLMLNFVDFCLIVVPFHFL